MVGQEEYFRSLGEYIDNLDEELKVSAPVYEERLTVCRQCDMLLEGMCRSCGPWWQRTVVPENTGCKWSRAKQVVR